MDPGKSFLLTDLYQLAMMQGYLEAGKTDTAAFEFFVRKLPDNGPEFVAQAVRDSIAAVGARAAYIEPGSP